MLYPAGCGVATVKVDNSGNGGQQDLVRKITFKLIKMFRDVPINTNFQVPMVNKGAHITAIALNPTRQLLAFTERGERPLLVIIFNIILVTTTTVMLQVVYDLERRKRVKLLRCAEFRTHEVVANFRFLRSRNFPGRLSRLLPRLEVPAGPGRFPGPSVGLLLLGEGQGRGGGHHVHLELLKVITSCRTVTPGTSNYVSGVSFHPKDRDVVCIGLLTCLICFCWLDMLRLI